MVEPQDGSHQVLFTTGTHHRRGFAALVPGKGDDLSLQLQDDLRDAHGEGFPISATLKYIKCCLC